MTNEIAGPAAAALQSLTPSQVAFLQALPKAELHAHLNGSIPISTLQELARDFRAQTGPYAGLPPSAFSSSSSAVDAGISQLQSGVALNEIADFFGLFPSIYALTSNPAALARATRAVLAAFLDGPAPQASYLELRTGPRETAEMSRRAYLECVLDEVERYAPERAALIVSLDRKADARAAAETMECAVSLRKAGRRVVGVDLCGDPTAGNVEDFAAHFAAAKAAGLSVTLHIAEVNECPAEETMRLLSFKPDRLGHATFLDADAKKVVHTEEMCVEICLSSNLLCKTVPTLDAHHIRYYLGHDHPIAICTDDILPFRNSLLGEYALLLARPPLGLGLTESEVEKVARMSMECRFR